MIVDQYQVGDWIDAGLVQDVTDLVAGWPDRHFTTSFSSVTDREGSQFFIPVNADVYLMLVNKKALPYLPDGADVQSLTWEEFAQWAIRIAEGEGVGKTAVTGSPRRYWIYQFGSTALAYGAGFPDFNSAAAKEAWALWAEIGAADGFIPDVKKMETVVDVMQREEAWLTLLHCTQVAPVYALKEGQLIVAPMPRGPAGIGSVAGFSGLALLAGAPNQAGADAFMAYLTSPEVQVKIEKGTNGLVPTVIEAGLIAGEDAQGQVMAAGIKVLELGVVSGIPAGEYQDWGAVKQIFDDAFIKIVLNSRGELNESALEDSAELLEELRK
ncbi:MAG: extracellular solute-binding protein [Anaerolineaceae bacterium]|nr:extracellular solute-binding protein [Anaerolineaceae bacterium]